MLFESACPLLGDKECRQGRCAWWYAGKCAIVWLAKGVEEQILERDEKKGDVR